MAAYSLLRCGRMAIKYVVENDRNDRNPIKKSFLNDWNRLLNLSSINLCSWSVSVLLPKVNPNLMSLPNLNIIKDK
jgi:hypothetical protein